MTTIHFGDKCDKCARPYPDYNESSDISVCEDCCLDLCKRCALETGHTVLREQGGCMAAWACPEGVYDHA